MGGHGGPSEGLKMGGDGLIDNSGLNPRRQRGFGRIETPTLLDMQVKQGAVVSKFLTFLNRKKSLMIELYERAFYAKRPGWDHVANFIYNDLCPTDDLHKVLKMLSFIQSKCYFLSSVAGIRLVMK